LNGDRVTAAQDGSELNGKSGKRVASGQIQRLPKSDSRYWLPRIFKPVSGRGTESPHYSMKVAFKGKRMAFTLGTGNKEAAAKKARDIYVELLGAGTAATLAKHRTQKLAIAEGVATVGEWIAAAKEVFDGSPATFGGYARCLRLIGSDILQVEKTEEAFAKKHAGEFRRVIDAASLEIFTPEAVQAMANPLRPKISKSALTAERISCYLVQLDAPRQARR
jgi:hypothetical protein